MEDIVALRVTLNTGADRFFLTWGRVFDPVDPEPLIEVVKPHLVRMSRGEASKATDRAP